MEKPLLGSSHGDVGLWGRSLIESRKLWHIAGPAIFTSICNYSLGALTQTFTGQVGKLELAAVSMENSVIAGWGFGFLLGMGSALETLCGQAFGAGKLNMLGVYMQRSWLILFCTALLLTPAYVFSDHLLKLIGVQDDISDLAGKFAIWMLPQLFAYAANFPIQKFLQAQQKVMAMAWVAAVVLVIHAFLSWLTIIKLGWGLVGAAVTLNLSWWLVVFGEFGYIVVCCTDTWTGFSWLAFRDLWGFVKLSFASAVMLCLEFWYLMVLIVIVSYLPDPLVPVDAASICMNINGWDAMIAIGFNAAISVRVSNELGAGDSNAAKFAVWVVSVTSVAIGVVAMIIVFATQDVFPVLFSNSSAVQKEVTRLAGLLGITVALNSLQPVLSGVAVGAGWQAVIAYINIGCYYIVGLPAGILLGFTLKFGVEGIWGGMITGIALQTLILIVITASTDWEKEASQAESRVRKWGGSLENGNSSSQKNQVTIA
ncbi:protein DETOXIFICATION 33-like [Nymphaea colorata]|nr:protein DETOXIFICATION 33-like [Nymphaea colorata]XP_031483542.1 protein DETOXIFICATION 33-like [Nymphaea colorata]XP_031483543.1 protein DETOXIFICATION 33-like [Nymphaea colorata]